jgi:ABC-type lipoprotein export system ATPase subunit
MKVARDTPVKQTARVLQMSSLLDVPMSERSHVEWDVEMPLEEKPWSIGLIVGPSGSGKSTIAREMFGGRILAEQAWPTDESVLDAFPKDMPIKDIIGLMTSVGLGSAPTWLRPHHILSTGEQFRASMARALADTDGLVVVDEFTSVVDRQVAKVTSHAVQKTVRRRGQQFVAVTCHADIVDWLQPDWVYQPDLAEFTWRCLQPRPALQLDIYPVDRAVWRSFRRYHYLSANLVGGDYYGGFIDGQCVAFASVAHVPHPSPKARNIRRVRRLVTLPDWQGLGIGTRLEEFLAATYSARGYRFRSVVSHPGMVRYCLRSPRWRMTAKPPMSMKNYKGGKTSKLRFHASMGNPRHMLTYAFEYVPESVD